MPARPPRAPLSSSYDERVLWQTQTETPPATPGDLPDTVDVAVVGAGYCGLSAAAGWPAPGGLWWWSIGTPSARGPARATAGWSSPS